MGFLVFLKPVLSVRKAIGVRQFRVLENFFRYFSQTCNKGVKPARKV